jgi:hypothetical protein
MYISAHVNATYRNFQVKKPQGCTSSKKGIKVYMEFPSPAQTTVKNQNKCGWWLCVNKTKQIPSSTCVRADQATRYVALLPIPQDSVLAWDSFSFPSFRSNSTITRKSQESHRSFWGFQRLALSWVSIAAECREERWVLAILLFLYGVLSSLFITFRDIMWYWMMWYLVI